MRRRCTYPKHPQFKNYGGRGITVCDRWQYFINFLEDVGLKPSKKHSLDRINNDGNYEPGNVRWATQRQQTQNKRTNIRVTYNGETHCLSEWAKIKGMRRGRLSWRLQHNWSIPCTLNESIH